MEILYLTLVSNGWKYLIAPCTLLTKPGVRRVGKYRLTPIISTQKCSISLQVKGIFSASLCWVVDLEGIILLLAMFVCFSLLTFHNLSALASALFITCRDLVAIYILLRVFKCLDKFEEEYFFLSTPSRHYFISKIQEKCLCEKHHYIILRILHNKWLPLTDYVIMPIHLHVKLVLWSEW